ncbi:MAG: ABC transporter permease, partial [Actinomycetota bacterium]|nr:ABC transporter permease [Actinomycetota bacterium]
LLAAAIWQLKKRSFVMATASLGIAGLGLLWYFSTDVIPGDFTEMAPYVTTLLVLALFSQRLRMPAADGLRYRRGEAG